MLNVQIHVAALFRGRTRATHFGDHRQQEIAVEMHRLFTAIAVRSCGFSFKLQSLKDLLAQRRHLPRFLFLLCDPGDASRLLRGRKLPPAGLDKGSWVKKGSVVYFHRGAAVTKNVNS
jgi:hypothetical protein